MPPTGFAQMGDYKEARISAGRIGYHDVGEGPTLVFVHGLLANSALWSRLVPLLADRYRCITPDWPLGSHTIPLDSNEGLSPFRGADLIGEFIDELGLDRPTLVGNDTGGALCQMLVVRRPGVAERMILTNCDAYDQFPPQPFKYLLYVPRVPGALTFLTWTMRPRFVRRLPIAYGWLAKRMPRDVEDAFVGPIVGDRRIRADVGAFLRAADKQQLVATSQRYGEIEIPVVLAWGEDDKSFKLALGERMKNDIPTAKLVRIPDSYTFVSLDQPERLAAVIAEAVPAANPMVSPDPS